ncbi:hypothetical protein WDW89_04200 [Deltaproteobacteria bacterium TL4]
MSTKKRHPLSDELKQQFAGTIILDRTLQEQGQIHASLLNKNDKFLEPYLDRLHREGILEINADNYYVATSQGKEAYGKMLQQQASYVTHFDIYSHVDLQEGVFAEKDTDFLEDDRWEDLRVAVAEFKGIDPYRVVFLAMLSDEYFFEDSDWKFDLAMGSLFEEMEDIVQSQLSEEELGYEEEGEYISGHEVLQDIIEQGARLNQERFEQRQSEEREEKRTDDDDFEEEEVVTTVHYGGGYGYPAYNPWATFGAYAASALFIEAMWHDPYW